MNWAILILLLAALAPFFYVIIAPVVWFWRDMHPQDMAAVDAAVERHPAGKDDAEFWCIVAALREESK